MPSNPIKFTGRNRTRAGTWQSYPKADRNADLSVPFFELMSTATGYRNMVVSDYDKLIISLLLYREACERAIEGRN